MHKRLTDPTFRYFSSADTDVRRTFKRVLAEQKKAAAQKVVPIRKEAK